MRYQEVIDYYVTGYRFHKETGMSATTFHRFRDHGYIPIATQHKLAELSGGALRADIEDYYRDIAVCAAVIWADD